MEISIKIQKTINLSAEANSDTVDLKLKFLDSKGTFTHHRDLIVTTKELENGLTLDGLNVQQDSIFQMHFHPRPKIKIFVTSLSHETLILDVDTSHTIENIKAKIQEKLMIEAPLEGELYFAGKMLDDDCTLVSYGFEKTATLFLGLKQDMQILVKNHAGKTITLLVNKSDTVDSVMGKIQAKDGTPVEKQRLIFAGKLLQIKRNLADYDIEPGSTLQLFPCSSPFRREKTEKKRTLEKGAAHQITSK